MKPWKGGVGMDTGFVLTNAKRKKNKIKNEVKNE